MGRGSVVHGIVLAGAFDWGEGFFGSVPRPLLPVAHTPLICYALGWLREAGVEGATICANHATRALKDGLQGCGFCLTLDYYQDASPRGAAGCARDAAERTAAETFLVADSTAIPNIDPTELLATHNASGAAMTVVVHEGPGSPRGTRRPPSPAGLYVLERRIFELVPKQGFQDIKEDLIPRLYRGGERVTLFRALAAPPRVLSPESYLGVNAWMIERLAQHPLFIEGYRAEGEVVSHPSAQLDPAAKVVGPVLLGPRAIVMAGATIVGPTAIGPECSIGRGAVVSRSVTWTRSAVREGAIVDRCVLGEEAVVPRGERLFSALRGSPRRVQLSHRLGWGWPGVAARPAPPQPAFRPALRVGGGVWARGAAAAGGTLLV